MSTICVVCKVIDGLFYTLAQEETRIRKDPAGDHSLLKEVFGKNILEATISFRGCNKTQATIYAHWSRTTFFAVLKSMEF